MALTIDENDPKLIGKPVYRTYSPQKAGKIISYIGKQSMTTVVSGQSYASFPPCVKVLWVKGNMEEVSVYNLRDLEALVADTQRKLNTHLKTLERVKQL